MLTHLASLPDQTKTSQIPIVFVASCFGGLLLAKALLIPGASLFSVTKGILFLGTPFRGSEGTGPAEFRVWVASLLGANASSSLLQVLKKEPGDLKELVDRLVTEMTVAVRDHGLMVGMFYETRETDISKALPSLVGLVAAGAMKLLKKGQREIVVRSPEDAGPHLHKNQEEAVYWDGVHCLLGLSSPS